MKSWVSGKQLLLQEVEKAYDLIGRNLAAEIDEEDTARVNKTQLRELEERSSKYQDLIQGNPQFEEELQRYKIVCSKLEELTNSNKRLTAELEQAVRKETPLASSPAKPDHILSDPIIPLIIPSTTRSFLNQIEPNEHNPGTQNPYEALVEKYNIVYEQWDIQNEGRKMYEEKWKREREKVKDWLKYSERQDKSIANKKQKIKMLEEEVRYLKSHHDHSRFVSEEVLLDGAQKSATPALKMVSPHSLPSPVSAIANTQFQEAPATARRSDEYVADVLLLPEQGPQEYVVKRPEFPIQLPHEETENFQLPTLPHNMEIIILDSQAESDTEYPIYHEISTVSDDSVSKQNEQAVREDDIVKQQPAAEDQESPVFLSVRRVKKRRRGSDTELPKLMPIVKQEVLSSSPISPARFDQMGSNDSVDLDEIGHKVDTPRKHRRRLLELTQVRSPISKRTKSGSQSIIWRQTPAQIKANTKYTSQTTPARKTTAGHAGSALQPRSANEQIVPKSDNKTSKKRRLASDMMIEALAEDGRISTPLPSRNNPSFSGKLEDLLGKPPSQIKPVKSPCRLNEYSKCAAKATTQHIQKAQDAQIEDSDLGSIRNPCSASARPKVLNPKPITISRTQQERASENIFSSTLLLSRPNPEESVGNCLPSKPSSIDTPVASIKSARNGELSWRITASKTPRRSRDVTMPGGAQSRGKVASLTLNGADMEMDQERESIRSRPVASLTLEDFKVNPNYNQGYNYAYSDVVRNKDERRCLQGCTKPRCCGARFRALALATRPLGEMTSSQEEADNELLHEFLGGNAYKVRNMTRQERDDVLLQAKTRELANKHGRHRHMYEKPSSPPGFWRADFPTTQEDLLDRERAKEVERDQIVQRYEEAMRPGGAFIFRDERGTSNAVE